MSKSKTIIIVDTDNVKRLIQPSLQQEGFVGGTAIAFLSTFIAEGTLEDGFVVKKNRHCEVTEPVTLTQLIQHMKHSL